MVKINVIIMGAAGRDFHNFNTYYRDNDLYQVVAFTATQIPNIEGRLYPPELAGDLYPKGIPIHDESELVSLIQTHHINEVVFSYSDIRHTDVMHLGSMVNAAGADFKMMGISRTAIKSTKPVIGICAVRTGCGKSQTTRKISEIFKSAGMKVAVIRHPMPYGDLSAQAVQRFSSLDDLEKHDCTIEEMEEYEPHINRGTIVYAGVDYEAIVREAEQVADVILWDGGNNDMPFYQTDLLFVVVDPHRSGHETQYYPGETNLRMADVVIINKIKTANPENVEELRTSIAQINPKAKVVDAASPVTVDDPGIITGKRVLVVEDGPTLTHGEMKYGAGVVAANQCGALELVDPRPFAQGSIARTFDHYPDIGMVLPAMGYGNDQVRDLETTINNTDCDAVVIGTPIDLRRIVNIKHPSTRVTYELDELGDNKLDKILSKFTT
ncbi:MAG: cyclic 2,3-diphosphoglycerate synthase [Candidatus Neomarinimicrobiota bacterium]|nr:cyclic 2,3-diphosphoglycerate synthase [Candidatus Neomarinimicrobiota bacterium]|tara:strand:+ start:382 stop:1698 length:1317 start_codon:yes stop_codon:yes gene_type:complete